MRQAEKVAYLSFPELRPSFSESCRGESHGFSFKRFFSSAVFQSDILQDAILSIQVRHGGHGFWFFRSRGKLDPDLEQGPDD